MVSTHYNLKVTVKFPTGAGASFALLALGTAAGDA